MDQFDCFYDANRCLICPEVPPIAPTPTTYEHVPLLGWTAGANSIKQLDGNLQVQFSLPALVVGAVLGLRAGRQANTTPSLVEHGLYFQSKNGNDIWQVIELGVVKTAAATRAATDVFTIRRIGHMVQYFVQPQGGAMTLVYASTLPSRGVRLVNACLYASGDQIGA